MRRLTLERTTEIKSARLILDENPHLVGQTPSTGTGTTAPAIATQPSTGCMPETDRHPAADDRGKLTEER